MPPPTHWYQTIAVIPQANTSVAYRRLARIFRDRTRVGKQSGHELVRTGHETRVTVNIFEHFALLPNSWVSRIADAAGIDGIKDVAAVQWSYEFETIRDKRWPKMIRDVTIHYRTPDSDGTIVIETKVRPGALDLSKDITGYTGHQVFDAVTGPKHLVYVLDDASFALYASDLRAGGSHVLRWSDIIGIHLQMFAELGLAKRLLSDFIEMYRSVLAWLPVGGLVTTNIAMTADNTAPPSVIKAIEDYISWTRVLVNPQTDAASLASIGPEYLSNEISFADRMALHISDARVNYTEAIWRLA
jgi:hypothetical protein